MKTNGTLTVDAEPYVFEFKPETCALVIIDMQRDFLEPGGFGEMLGNDVSQLRGTIAPNKRLIRVRISQDTLSKKFAARSSNYTLSLE